MTHSTSSSDERVRHYVRGIERVADCEVVMLVVDNGDGFYTAMPTSRLGNLPSWQLELLAAAALIGQALATLGVEST